MLHFKILRVSHLAYPVALKAFLLKYKNIESYSFNQQQSKLFSENLVYSDSFSYAMRLLGHESNEIVYDVEILQKQWAKEHCLTYSEINWQQEILLAQIKSYRPDILFFQHQPPFSDNITSNLKKYFPFHTKNIGA